MRFSALVLRFSHAVMRVSPAVVIAFVFCFPFDGVRAWAQAGPGALAGPGAGGAASPVASQGLASPSAEAATIGAGTIGSALAPSLDTVHQTLAALRLDRWKKGTVRDEASTYIDQIQHDIASNVPPLVETADGAPGSVGKALPLAKHLGALYDVLLRVEEAARVVAPDDQVGQLQSALNSLETARLALNDRMQGSADAMEKQVVDLRGVIRQQASRPVAPPVPVSVPCTPPVVHHTAVRKKPVTAATTTPATNGPAKPGATPQNNQNAQKKPATTGTSQAPATTSH
jgi:hypothetical protein